MVPALDFSYTNSTGVFYGVRLGYNIALGSKDAWKNGIDKNASVFTDNTNSFFIQLKLGGVLDLKKKKKTTDLKQTNLQLQQKNTNMNTSIVDNNGDKLYTIIYPNPGKETIILLHGGPGFQVI
jgi:hypothetical protein